MRAFAWILALGLVASPAMAGAGVPGESDSSSSAPAKTASTSSNAAPTAATPATAAPAKAAEPSSVELSNEIQQLRDLIESQSTQIQLQNDQLKAQQDKMLELQSQVAAIPNQDVLAANALTAAIGPSTGIGMPTSSAGSSGQDKPGPPTSISFKGITLTPGGYMAAESVWRQKALGADINTPSFGSAVPFDGSSNANMSEFNASGRQSRISMLVEGKLSDVKIGGYYEMDFLSAGVTSNNNQSNSYTLRQRQFWGQAAFNNGFTFTGGQMWSLVTETGHAMDNRTENLPMTIDAQYHVGFSWTRQYGFRVTKSLLDNKLWLGFSVEAAQGTVTVHGQPTAQLAAPTLACTTPGTNNCSATGTYALPINLNTTYNNFLLGTFGNSGGLYNPLGNYAYNLAPDLVFKAVWEPGFGHYEVFGLLSQFRDRAFPCVPITPKSTVIPTGCVGSPTLPVPAITSAANAFNDSRTGGGAGANARWSLLQKKVDLGIHFLGGSGIGRYGSSGLPDMTTRPNGTLALLRNYQALGTLQLHPVPKLDVYFNIGGEFTNRAEYKLPNSTVGPNEGYGAIGFSNAGCWSETLPVTGPSTSTNLGVPSGVGGSTGFIPGPLASCTGDIRRVVEGTVGFWYRFYSGPKGKVQMGVQYSNYVRQAFSGLRTSTTLGDIGSSGEPKADENMVFTSFRYYLP